MMTENKVDFPREVSRLLPVLLREVTRRQKEFLSKELAISHIVILDYLLENGPSKMTELSRQLNMTLSAVTSIIDKMVSSGYVERKTWKKDRRVVKVSLRSKGKETTDQVNQERSRMARDVFSVLEEKEKKEYLRLLRKVCDNLSSVKEDEK